MDIDDSFQRTTDGIFGFLPNLLGFLLILLIGYIVAKVVAGLVGKLLERTQVDRKLQESSASRYVDAVLPGARPSQGIAKVVFWLIFLVFLFAAVGVLEIATLTTFMNDVLAYLPNVIVAILIFVVAALLSGAVAGAVTKFMGDTPTGKIVAGVVPALIMVIAFFMILEQLQIAPEIVRIAFAAVMFALALGLALAFGLGGRDVAQRLLDDAYRKGGEAREQAKQDVATGRARAEQAWQESDLSGDTGSASTGNVSGNGSAYGESTHTMPMHGTTGTGYPSSDPSTDQPRY